MNTLYPIFLKLEELTVLLVGAGNVGKEKLDALLSSSPQAKITIVAPYISDGVKHLASYHQSCNIYVKKFESIDLENKNLVILATDDTKLHQEIKLLCEEKKILCNVADTPHLCDFYLGSVVQKGNLKIGISTNGLSPTVSKRLKEVLNDFIPNEIDESLTNIHAIRSKMNGSFHQKVKKLNKITKVLVENENIRKAGYYRKIASYSLIIFTSMFIGHYILSYFSYQEVIEQYQKISNIFDKNFGWMLLAGFLAQMVDGALGMGYGITSATILLSTGINPAAISGSIHTAEMFASGASGYSHYKFGNVNKKLFKLIVIPGVIGAVLGAVALVYLGEEYGKYCKPVVAIYTLFLGIKFIFNAFKEIDKKPFKHYGWLAGFGGFFDSFGGGGWGPIVTTTLINKGRTHRFVVGTVSLTEFFVTMSSAITFFIFLGISHWQTILGLIAGGLLAAPIAAKLAGKMPKKTAYILLGILVILWSMKILWKVISS